VVSKKVADWTKIRAYSENKEANTDFKEKLESGLQQLRRPPGPGISFPEQVSPCTLILRFHFVSLPLLNSCFFYGLKMGFQ
jgi:hypothetical protein